MTEMMALAHEAAAEIFEAFTLYQRSFRRITQCAKGRFEQRGLAWARTRFSGPA